jgi:hypothetical protein
MGPSVRLVGTLPVQRRDVLRRVRRRASNELQRNAGRCRTAVLTGSPVEG